MAKKTKAGGTNLKPFYLLLGLIAVVGVVLIIAASRNKGGASQAVTEPIDLGDLDTRALVQKAQGVTVGQESAPVKVFVFSDYMCGGCGYFSTSIYPQLKSEFVDAGKVQFTYYDFPLGGSHIHSFVASRAARCAGDQGKFWEYHDLLLGRQQDWTYSRVVPMEQFLQFADIAGVDRADLEGCINSDTHAEVVTANRQLGDQLGVNSTPTVILNGRHSMSPLEWAGLRAEIRRELGEE